MSTPPDSVKCPVCYEVYPGKIYQCSKGHGICHICYDKLYRCPKCRIQFEGEPSRCLMMEALMEEMGYRKKVDCPFKSSGCNGEIMEHLLEEHVDSCMFNEKKYGRFINVCKSINLPNCDFRINRKNSFEVIEHLCTEHGGNSYEGKLPISFTLALLGVDENLPDAKAFCYRPHIVHFRREGFAVIIGINEGKESVFFSPYFVSYASGGMTMVSKCQVKFTFKTTTLDSAGNNTVKMSVSPVDILKSGEFQWERFNCTIPTSMMAKTKTVKGDKVTFGIELAMEK